MRAPDRSRPRRAPSAPPPRAAPGAAHMQLPPGSLQPSLPSPTGMSKTTCPRPFPPSSIRLRSMPFRVVACGGAGQGRAGRGGAGRGGGGAWPRQPARTQGAAASAAGERRREGPRASAAGKVGLQGRRRARPGCEPRPGSRGGSAEPSTHLALGQQGDGARLVGTVVSVEPAGAAPRVQAGGDQGGLEGQADHQQRGCKGWVDGAAAAVATAVMCCLGGGGCSRRHARLHSPAPSLHRNNRTLAGLLRKTHQLRAWCLVGRSRGTGSARAGQQWGQRSWLDRRSDGNGPVKSALKVAFFIHVDPRLPGWRRPSAARRPTPGGPPAIPLTGHTSRAIVPLITLRTLASTWSGSRLGHALEASLHQTDYPAGASLLPAAAAAAGARCACRRRHSARCWRQCARLQASLQ